MNENKLEYLQSQIDTLRNQLQSLVKAQLDIMSTLDTHRSLLADVTRAIEMIAPKNP